MRSVKIIFCTILLFFPVSSCAGIGFGKPEIMIQVVDENQTPVTDVDVSFSFLNYPQDDKFMTKTDKDGFARVKKYGDQRVSITAEKIGYYYSERVVEFNNGSKSKTNYDQIHEIILKKKRKPIPMYAKRIVQIKVPLLDNPVGFDLEVSDWVKPYGEGKNSDFIVNYHRTSENEDWFNTVEITFSNELDGIQEFIFAKGDTSSFKWPFLAPITGYKNKLVKEKSFVLNKGSRTNINDKNNYIFRVRTQLDQTGNINKYLVGKILGDFDIGGQMIAFTYYLNPDGTRNLEFDPKQNLYKFNRDEFMNKVQKP